METCGINMLKSIQNVFELLPVPLNKAVFLKECIDKSDLIKEIDNDKCPVVHTIDLSLRTRDAVQKSLHIMVATGVHYSLIDSSIWIQCKNSYRQNQGK